MQLNVTTDYAFRVVLHLAQKEGEIVSRKEIAAHHKVTTMFLQKIMASLMEAGLVESHRGARGGFRLARPAKTITLLDVIEALEGKFHINRCLEEDAFCSRGASPDCAVRCRLLEVQKVLIREMSGLTFEDLAKREQQRLCADCPAIESTEAAEEA